MNMFEELHNEEKYWEEQRKIQRQKDIATGRKEGIEIGRKKGIEIGEEKGNIKLIKALLNLNIPINQMVQLTKLPEEKIIDIINSL